MDNEPEFSDNKQNSRVSFPVLLQVQFYVIVLYNFVNNCSILVRLNNYSLHWRQLKQVSSNPKEQQYEHTHTHAHTYKYRYVVVIPDSDCAASIVVYSMFRQEFQLSSTGFTISLCQTQTIPVDGAGLTAIQHRTEYSDDRKRSPFSMAVILFES